MLSTGCQCAPFILWWLLWSFWQRLHYLLGASCSPASLHLHWAESVKFFCIAYLLFSVCLKTAPIFWSLPAMITLSSSRFWYGVRECICSDRLYTTRVSRPPLGSDSDIKNSGIIGKMRNKFCISNNSSTRSNRVMPYRPNYTLCFFLLLCSEWGCDKWRPSTVPRRI
jgi:hypothetical protein